MNRLRGSARRDRRAGRAPAHVNGAGPTQVCLNPRLVLAVVLDASRGEDLCLQSAGGDLDGARALRHFGDGESRFAVVIAGRWCRETKNQCVPPLAGQVEVKAPSVAAGPRERGPPVQVGAEEL